MPPTKSKSSKPKPKATKKDSKVFKSTLVPLANNISPQLSWPFLFPIKSLATNDLLQDQIILIPFLFSSSTCSEFINLINTCIPFSFTRTKKGEAYRDHDRFSIHDPLFASRLYIDTGLCHVLEHIKSKKKSDGKPKGLNPNIRVYRYKQGQRFAQHFDDEAKVDGIDEYGNDDNQERKAQLWSEWTLLIYLNGGEETCNEKGKEKLQGSGTIGKEKEETLQGGETVFYLPKNKGEIRVAPKRGMALLHRHGVECLLHEALEVKKGIKYVLRSDLIFG